MNEPTTSDPSADTVEISTTTPAEEAATLKVTSQPAEPSENPPVTVNKGGFH